MAPGSHKLGLRSGGWFHLTHPHGVEVDDIAAGVRVGFDVVELADHCITSTSTPQHVDGSWLRDDYPRFIPRDDPIDDGSWMHNVADKASVHAASCGPGCYSAV